MGSAARRIAKHTVSSHTALNGHAAFFDQMFSCVVVLCGLRKIDLRAGYKIFYVNAALSLPSGPSLPHPIVFFCDFVFYMYVLLFVVGSYAW